MKLTKPCCMRSVSLLKFDRSFSDCGDRREVVVGEPVEVRRAPDRVLLVAERVLATDLVQRAEQAVTVDAGRRRSGRCHRRRSNRGSGSGTERRP